MKRILICILMFLLSISFSTFAIAIPIQWTASDGGNGNWYDFVAARDISWIDANSAAQAATYSGMTGHLITITSAEEQNFFWNSFVNNYGQASSDCVWLGGTNISGAWAWVTDEVWNYTNWNPNSNEPNNSGGNEHYLTTHGSNGLGQWNDQDNIADSGPQVGYFVEYESSSAPVPEPATIMLFGIGLLGLAGVSRRKK